VNTSSATLLGPLRGSSSSPSSGWSSCAGAEQRPVKLRRFVKDHLQPMPPLLAR